MAFEILKKILEKNGFTVSVFATAEEAAAYLNREIDGVTVGMGGSMTLKELGVQDSLSAHNVVFSHGYTPCDPKETMDLAAKADVYLLSANGIDGESGAILNIDGTGNRVSSTLYGHKKVYFVAGKNKISPNFHAALQRVRNVVAPKNAQRLGRKTPCALNGDRCYDCESPDRICKALVVHYQKVRSMDMEVVLIDQELGY